MTKQKIFVSAYACEPGLGSEIGVGWHWVLEMSKYFDLWVLTRESNRQSIEPWIAKHPEYNHIHFLYFDLPKWARFWKKGLRGVRLAMDDERYGTANDAGKRYPYFSPSYLWQRLVESEQVWAKTVFHLGTCRGSRNDSGRI